VPALHATWRSSASRHGPIVPFTTAVDGSSNWTEPHYRSEPAVPPVVVLPPDPTEPPVPIDPPEPVVRLSEVLPPHPTSVITSATVLAATRITLIMTFEVCGVGMMEASR
jgi:hypothetical protein